MGDCWSLPSRPRSWALFMGLLIFANLIGLLVAPVHSEQAPIQYVMTSGDHVSCGLDNQGLGTSLCFSASSILYRLTNEIDSQHDYYAVLLTIKNENQSLHITTTEIYLSLTFPAPVSPFGNVDAIPSGGCHASEIVPASQGPFGGEPYFYVQTPNGCTFVDYLVGSSTNIVRWHECAQNNCPYTGIVDSYTQFAIGVTVPENQTVPFSFTAKVTLGKPSGCCFNEILSTSTLHWSTGAGAQSAASQPPPPSWKILWPYWLIGAAAITIATPTVLLKVPRFIRPIRQIQSRPRGIKILSVLFMIQGATSLVGALRLLFPSLSALTIVSSVVEGHPYWTLAIALFSLSAGTGLWNGREWGRELGMLAAVFITAGSIFFAIFSGALAILFLFAIMAAIYVLGYLQRPQIKAFFEAPNMASVLPSTPTDRDS